jgi:sugar diacid utilization regulator
MPKHKVDSKGELVLTLKEVIKKETSVEITLEEFHMHRRELSKRAETF